MSYEGYFGDYEVGEVDPLQNVKMQQFFSHLLPADVRNMQGKMGIKVINMNSPVKKRHLQS